LKRESAEGTKQKAAVVCAPRRLSRFFGLSPEVDSAPALYQYKTSSDNTKGAKRDALPPPRNQPLHPDFPTDLRQ
jgi:hypothetical protein